MMIYTMNLPPDLPPSITYISRNYVRVFGGGLVAELLPPGSLHVLGPAPNIQSVAVLGYSTCVLTVQSVDCCTAVYQLWPCLELRSWRDCSHRDHVLHTQSNRAACSSYGDVRTARRANFQHKQNSHQIWSSTFNLLLAPAVSRAKYGKWIALFACCL